MSITMTPGQYQALLHYAEAGAGEYDVVTEFEALRSSIDTANGVTRYVLVVRYQEVPQAPAVIGRTEPYPAGMDIRIEQTRPITRADVDAVLLNKQTTSALVLVTPDPRGVVGWSELDAYVF